MSLCENVYRRGGVYWWRKKLRCGQPPTSRLIALSLKVREPSRARALAARLNARFHALGNIMLPANVSLENVRSILAEMVRDEIKYRNEGSFSAQNGPERLDLNPGEDQRESLIRDERVFAAVYAVVAKYGKGLKVDAALENELRGTGFSQDDVWRIVDVLKVELPRFLQPGPDAYGPPAEYFDELLRRNAIEPQRETIAFFWRQFLSVRAKTLADTDSRYSRSLTDLDGIYAQINREMDENPVPRATPAAAAAPSSPIGPSPTQPQPVALSTPPSPVTRVTSPDEHPLMIMARGLLEETVKDARDPDTETRDVDVRHSRSLYRMFSKLLIEKEIFAIADIRQTHLSDLKDLFAVLPTSYGKNGRDETLSEMRARALILPAGKIGLSSKTWNKHISSLNKLIKYVEGKGIPIDTALKPFNLRRKIIKRGRDNRSSLSEGDLISIFQLPCFTGCLGWRKQEPMKPGKGVYHRALYFATMLLHYTGGRRDEICGLHIVEVVANHATPHIILRPNKTRRLKNANSDRALPIHPELLRLGFLDYVAEVAGLGYDLVFPDLVSPSSSSPLGDRLYDEFIRGLELAVPEQGRRKKVIHSFRHTLGATLKREEVSSEVRGDILGHGGNNVTEEVYVDPTDLAKKLMLIMKLVNVTDHLPSRPIRLLPWVIKRETAPFSQPNRSRQAKAIRAAAKT